MKYIETCIPRTDRMKYIRLFLSLICLVLLGATAGAQGSKQPPAESRYASLDGARIHYESYGKGRAALVLIHGWSCSIDYWRDLIPDLSKRSRLIAIDLPGHGLSDKPQVSYTMDLFACAVEAVLRDAGVDRAVLVGHSMGTPVIREFYRKYPQKTLALVIVDGPLRAFGDRKMMEQFIAPLRGPGYKEAASKFIDGMFGQNATAEMRAEIKNAMLNTPQAVAISAMEGMADESIWKQDKITVPTLAIMAKSGFLATDAEQSYRSIAPKLEYQVWEGVGHFLMMEKPGDFNEALG